MANDYWKKWYKKNRRRFNEVANKHKRKRRKEMRKLISERKGGPCIMCMKCYHPEAMDFYNDGDDKKFQIGDAGRKIYSLKSLEEELDKCNLYCAVCRRILHNENFLNEEPLGSSGIRRKKLRDLIHDLKSNPCADCGEVFPPYAMDFDHLGEVPKEGTVAKMVSWGLPEKKILDEVDKCESICVNCHRIRTSTRRQLDKIKEWIDKNVKENKDYSKDNTNPCFFYSAMVVALFPNLKLMKGKQDPPGEGDIAHFWVEDAGGNVIDPAWFRNPDAKNVNGKEISLIDNLQDVIDDELFKTIDKEEQDEVRELLEDD